MTNTNRAGTRSILFLLIPFLLLTISVHAIDRSPCYDYSGKNNTCTPYVAGSNSPMPAYFMYNTSYVNTLGLSGYTFPGNGSALVVNQTGSTLLNYTNSTPFTIYSKFQMDYYNAPTCMLFKYGQDTTSNQGWGQVVVGDGRLQVKEGNNTQTGSNATGNITIGKIQHAHMTWDGTRINLFLNNNLQLNVTPTTTTGYLPNTTDSNNPVMIGTQTFGSLRCGNTTIFETQVHQAVLNQVERQEQINGTDSYPGFANTTNLQLWFTYQNTTSTSLTIDPTTPIRVMPPKFLGMQSVRDPYVANMWGGPGNTQILNQTEYQIYINRTTFGSGYGFPRNVFDFSNTVATYNSTTRNVTWNRNTGSGQTSKNILFQQDAVRQAVREGAYVLFNDDDITPLIASNDSECYYGLDGVGGADPVNASSCRPYTNGSYVQGAQLHMRIVALALDEFGCFNYSGQQPCAYEGPNEFYRAAVYLRNTTAVPETGTCAVRNARYNQMYNDGRNPTQLRTEITAIGRNASEIRYYLSGSQYNDNTCSVAINQNWSTQHPYGSVNGTDALALHTYLYSCSNIISAYENDTIEEYQMAQLGGYENNYFRTEGSIDCNVINEVNRTENQMALMSNLIYTLNNTGLQAWSLFKGASSTTAADETDSNFNFRGSALTAQSTSSQSILTLNNITLTGQYDVFKIFNTLPDGTTLYPCNPTDSLTRCLYFKYNASTGYVLVDNRQIRALDIDNITITGQTITAAKRIIQSYSMRINTTETVAGGKADVSALYPFGSTIFELTINVSNVSLTQQPSSYIVNITEPRSQQFNITLTNPSNVSYTVSWTMNGTNQTTCYNLTTCTFNGGYTTAGNYNITATVAATTNSVNATWLLQINNTLSNISATYTPTSSTPTISTSQSQGFTYTLTNIDSIATTSTWRLNGVNQTTCFNTSSCTFNGGTIGVGSYAVNVTIVSSLNNLTRAWTLTVNQDTCSDIANGTALRAFMFILPLLFFAFMWMVFSTVNLSFPVVLVLTLSIIAFIGAYPGLLAMVCIL